MLGQLIVSGLAVGFCYALLALAMVIIYKTSEVLNFAQGEMAMISSFIAFLFLDSYQLSFPIALVLTLLFAAALGVLLEFAFMRPAKNPTVIGMIIITLGFEMILMGIAGWRWGPDQQSMPFPVPGFETYNFGGLVVSKINFWTIVICLILIILLFLFFQYSKLGTAMRATQPVCTACHEDKQGPFVFKHPMGRDERRCETCHRPHGSTNPKMLTRAQVRFQCLECHTNTPSSHDQTRTRFQNCTVCHSRIHGSNLNRLFLE